MFLAASLVAPTSKGATSEALGWPTLKAVPVYAKSALDLLKVGFYGMFALERYPTAVYTWRTPLRTLLPFS